MKFEDMTLLVDSCDRYEDAWKPFFGMLHVFAEQLDCPMALITETKQYKDSHYDVKVLNCDPKYNWSQCTAEALKHIDTEFVFLLLEDFFLQAPLDYEGLNYVLEYMREHKDVGCVHLAPNGRFKELPDDRIIDRNFDSLNITVTPVVYRKDFLAAILRPHEDAWDFEAYAGIRAKKYPYKVMQYNEKYPEIFHYLIRPSQGYGISKGQWMPKNKELFEKYGIEVNYDNLGINYEDFSKPEADGKRAGKNNNPYHDDHSVKGRIMCAYYHYLNKSKAKKSLK